MTDSKLSRSQDSPSIASIEDGIGENWNGLSLQDSPFEVEKIFDYVEGGHHPVHLDDLLGEDRYRVLHKLGNGGFANVWLCRDMHSQDTTRYVAVKILMAEASSDDCSELSLNKIKGLDLNGEIGAKYICLPMDQFKIDGPNGSHLCFVYPVLGPSVSSSILNKFEGLDKTLRKLSLETVQALDFLHSHGICHGDYTPRNILLRIDELDGLSENQVYEILGEPRVNYVLSESEQYPIEPRAPKYLIYPILWELCPNLIKDEACIIDFGESFEATNPPDNLGIPGPYRSPELMLDKTPGYASDIWALGCTLFKIRTGRKLFDLFDDDDDVYLDAMVQMLGKLPEPWWSITWQKRKEWYEDETDANGLVIAKNVADSLAQFEEERSESEAPESTIDERASREPESLGDMPIPEELAQLQEGSPEREVPESTVAEWVVREPKSLQDMLAPGLWYVERTDGWPCTPAHKEISLEERELFGDLLGKIMKLDPAERLTTKEVLDHGWFKM